MGVFDDVRIQWTLPWPEVQDTTWQSHDTPEQFLDSYEIRADGTLWHEAHDQRVEIDSEAPAGFWLHRDNERWEQEKLDGEIECHKYIEHDDRPGGIWYSVRFWFRGGMVADAIYDKSDTGKAAETAEGG